MPNRLRPPDAEGGLPEVQRRSEIVRSAAIDLVDARSGIAVIEHRIHLPKDRMVVPIGTFEGGLEGSSGTNNLEGIFSRLVGRWWMPEDVKGNPFVIW